MKTKNAANPIKIKTCFSPRYYAPTPTQSMRKLRVIAGIIEREGLVDIIAPGRKDEREAVEAVYNLHDPKFVKSFLAGRGGYENCQGWEWSTQIRDGVVAMSAGQLIGAELAFKHGIAANIAQGAHHSTYHSGSAYCTFNSLALVAKKNPTKKIFVLDCDQHGGNGTQDFAGRLPNLWNFTINGSNFGTSNTERSTSITLPRMTEKFSLYLAALVHAFNKIDEVKPDLVEYNAGMDCHIADPLGSLGLTEAQLIERDTMVFEFLKRRNIPCLISMAGGYNDDSNLLGNLHANTFRAAVKVYGKK